MRKLIPGLLIAIGLIVAPMGAYADTPTPAPAPTAESTAPPVVVLGSSLLFSAKQTAAITDNFAQVAKDYGILPVVEIVKTLGGVSPQTYAVRRANELGVGDSNANNGLYILISLSPHALQVEPGTGLHRVVPASTIQSIVDNSMLPLFKVGNYSKGITDGVHAIGEASLQKPAAPAAATAPVDMSGFWTVLKIIGSSLLGILGMLLIISGVIALLKYHRERKEVARLAAVTTALASFTNSLDSEPNLIKLIAALPNRDVRFDTLASYLRAAPFTDDEAKANFTKFEKFVATSTVNYSGVDTKFYKSSLKEDESIDSFAHRVLLEAPAASQAQADAVAEIKRAQEAEELRKQHHAQAEVIWKTHSKEDKESYALASGANRQNIGEKLFSNYDEPNMADGYAQLGDGLSESLEHDAKKAFNRLPQDQRERIARASTAERKQYMSTYIPGYNPLLVYAYIAIADSEMSTIRSDEARAREAATSYSSSSSDSSFGSFDSSSSFSGGSFDGGGGGGSW